MRHSIDKIASGFLRSIPFILAFFLPLFFLPFTPDFFGTNKQYLLLVLASLALLAFMVRMISKNKLQITLSPALLPVVFLSLIYIVSAILMHPNPRMSLFNETATMTALAIIFITVTSSEKDDSVLKTTILGLIVSACLLSIITVLQSLDLTSKLIAVDWVKNKFFSPAGSVYFYLLFAFPLMVATLSYAATLKNWTAKSFAFAASLIIGAGCLAGLKVILPTASQPGVALLPYSAGWSIAVDNFKTLKTALIGVGPENFLVAYTTHRPASLNLNPNLWSIRFSNSSSEALSVLTTVGILGFISLAIFILRPLISLARHKLLREDPIITFIFAGSLVSTIIFFLLPVAQLSYGLIFLFVIMSTLVMKSENDKSIKNVSVALSAQDDISDKQTALPVLPWIMMVLCLVLLGVFWNRSARIYLSNLSVYEAGTKIKDKPVESFNLQVKSVQQDPYNPYLRLNLANTYLAVADSYLGNKDASADDKKKALEYANQALNEAKIAASQNPNDVTIWENYANITSRLASYQVQGASDWTLATYNQAIMLDPNNPALYLQLGTFYYLLSDYGSAERVTDRAIALKPDWNVAYFNQALIFKAEKNYPAALAYMKQGLALTDQKSEDTKKIDEEIKSLEKLVPASATQSATPK